MQVSCRRVRSTTHSGVGGQTGSAQIWSTIHQQLRVPDLPPVSVTHGLGFLPTTSHTREDETRRIDDLVHDMAAIE